MGSDYWTVTVGGHEVDCYSYGTGTIISIEQPDDYQELIDEDLSNLTLKQQEDVLVPHVVLQIL